MEDKKLLTNEELEKVSGGYDGDFDASAKKLTFTLEPGENASLAVNDCLNLVIDSDGLLNGAAEVLNAPDRINTLRVLTVFIELVQYPTMLLPVLKVVNVQY